jgi:hypothetical protein
MDKSGRKTGNRGRNQSKAGKGKGREAMDE